MTDEFRLSESDVTAVLRRAADDAAERGLTAGQVQEIAASVGLSAAAVQRALDDAKSGMLRDAVVERRGGVPVSIRKEVLLPGPLSDASWATLVSTLRTTFAARGKESPLSDVREWRNGNLRATVEPYAGGYRFRMSTAKANVWGRTILAGGMSLAAGTIVAASAFGAVFDTAQLLAGGVMAIGGVAVLLQPYLTLPGWARQRTAQFDDVAREAAALAGASARQTLERPRELGVLRPPPSPPVDDA